MRPYFGKFSSWPQVSVRLWGTLLLGAVAGLNLIFKVEIWPYTPLAGAFWARALWVALVLAGPQAGLCGWHWLRGYQGPGLLRVALPAFYFGGSLLARLLWLLLAVGGIFGLGWEKWLWAAARSGAGHGNAHPFIIKYDALVANFPTIRAAVAAGAAGGPVWVAGGRRSWSPPKAG